MPIEIPEFLKAHRGWLVWKFEKREKDKKPRKVPYYVNGNKRFGVQGTPEDRAQLVSYDEALAVLGGYVGLGFAMHADWGLVGLDFDNCVVDGVVDGTVADLVAGTYSEFSPSGTGVHAFVTGACSNSKSKGPGFGFETFCTTGFLTFTGHRTPDCEMLGDGVVPMSAELVALCDARFGEGRLVPAGGGVVEYDPLMAELPADGIDLDNALRYAVHIDVNDYDEWREMGMALHHQFGGSAAGLALWDTWSQSGVEYQSLDDLRARWRGFGDGKGKVVTFRSIIKKHNERSVGDKYVALAEWKLRLGAATTEFEVRERVCTEIRRDERLARAERNSIAHVVQSKLVALGARYPIAECREFVTPAKKSKSSRSEIPEWAEGWVYVTHMDRFFRLDSDEWLTMQGFNARFNRCVPAREDGQHDPASWIALNTFELPVVTRAMYVPGYDPLFRADGTEFVNLYRPGTVPVAVDTLSGRGQMAVDTVLRHLDILCGGRPEVVTTLTSWMAHNVQNPGKKIRYSPLIKGIEGDGKSLLGGLMAAMMGGPNVKNISPKVLGTDFNGWAEGSCVGILEEIKLTGHSRYDILNALKPLITNDTVPIHRKGADEYNAINVTNYMAFTNYSDALPVGDSDRRWFIIFTRTWSPEQLATMFGCEPREYFDRLHKAINDHPASLRRYFLDYQIPAEFDCNGRAPMTEEKGYMVNSSVADDEQAARSIIESGAYGVSKNVVSSADLTTAMMNMDDPMHLESTAVNRLMVKLGYSKYPKVVNWDGKTRRIWIWGITNVTGEKIRKTLDETLIFKNPDFDLV